MAAADKKQVYINDPELYARIENAIAGLRPFFEADQGDIRLLGISKNLVVKVQLLGACKTCTISNLTLKAGIEDAVKRIAPEIVRVEAIG